MTDVTLTQAEVAKLGSALRHLEGAKIDRKAVAAEHGISRGDNAATAIKKVLNKLGLNYQKDKFINEGDQATAAPKTPKKRAPGGQGKGSSMKKRKVKDEDSKASEKDGLDGATRTKEVDAPLKNEDDGDEN